jgi:hypothetical protein
MIPFLKANPYPSQTLKRTSKSCSGFFPRANKKMEESQEIAEKKVLDLIESLLPDGCPILNCYRWGSKW